MGADEGDDGERGDGQQSPASVLVARAEAVLRSGRLASARPLFEAALAAATEQGDRAAAADAALGLGGLWLNEHRSPIDHERVLAIQGRSLAALPEGEERRALRLRLRLAAEEAYATEDREPLRSALDAARDLGDPAVLCEGLSLHHHTLLDPILDEERLAVAREIVQVAAAADEPLAALIGLTWLTVDQYLAEDPQADRSRAELEQRAEALPCDAVLYVARVMGVMVLIRAGRLDEAEVAADAALRLGLEVGDADALAYYSGQILLIRWLQGRAGEMVRAAADTVASPSLAPVNHGFTGALALAAAEAGDTEQAVAALDRLRRAGVAEDPHHSVWMVTMAIAMEAAAVVGDEATAAMVTSAFAELADRPVLGSLAVVCLGSSSRSLGLAAAVRGDLDEAVRLLTDAVAGSERMGNRPLALLSRADLALVLRRRGGPGDEARAIDLLDAAAAGSEAFGLERRAEAWRRAREDRATAPRAASGPAGEATVARRGGQWELTWRGRRVEVEHLVGMEHLAHLLVRPGQEVSALRLAGQAGDGPAEVAHEVLDEQARRELRARITDLQEEMAEAEGDFDDERAARARVELDALVDGVNDAIGLGGRSRRFSTSTERARTSVGKALRRAIDRIADADAELGRELGRAVQTGTRCTYRPGTDLPERWRRLEP
ncbi:MAG TPA: hypothetical protein VK507_12570 [Iamia sp.]|nr:hypothetical protein [Iamia sp.]